MPANPLTDFLITLVSNGLNINTVTRLPHDNTIVNVYKYDKLGARIDYSILFTEDLQETSVTDTLLFQANQDRHTPFIVAEGFKSTKCTTYTKKEFYDFFGGIVNSGLVLIPNLNGILNTLGHNELPAQLTGKPADLHEMYVKECLQFILESPTRRYGIDRSFESLPDVVILSRELFMLLVDSKAYKDGFAIQADDMKRFSSYVEDFRNRYTQYFGQILSFLVVSGHFEDSVDSLKRRSDELYQMCYCKMACITSEELGIITTLLRENPTYKHSVKWKSIFSQTIITIRLVQDELARIKKDNLL